MTLGSPGNPPGFDANLVGLNAGDQKTFDVDFPADYAVAEMAGTEVAYAATVKDVRRRVLPELDDEFAKDLGEFDSLAALRDARAQRPQDEAREHDTPAGARRSAEAAGRAAGASTRRPRWSSARSTGGWRNSRDS